MLNAWIEIQVSSIMYQKRILSSCPSLLQIVVGRSIAAVSIASTTWYEAEKMTTCRNDLATIVNALGAPGSARGAALAR